jgi:hypothetical protein
MKFLWIFPYYLGWHYSKGIVEVFTVFKDFLFFVPRLFSIKTLLKTLFSPFQRLQEEYAGGLQIEKFLESMTVNILMRVIGFILRSVVIVIGILATVATFILEIILFFVWLALPMILAFAFVSSVIALYKS